MLVWHGFEIVADDSAGYPGVGLLILTAGTADDDVVVVAAAAGAVAEIAYSFELMAR